MTVSKYSCEFNALFLKTALSVLTMIEMPE